MNEPDLLRVWVPVCGLLHSHRHVCGNYDGDVLLPAL